MNRKQRFMLCTLIGLFIMNLFNAPLYATEDIVDEPYTYKDYLREKEYEEEKNKVEQEESTKTMIITIVSIGIFILLIYFLYKRSLRIEKENKAIEEQNKALEIERRRKVLAEIQKRYPSFTLEGLLNFFEIVLIQIQKAVEDKDYNNLRLMETEEFYSIHREQIQQLGTDKYCYKKQSIVSLIPVSFLTGAEDTIVVNLEVSLITYAYDQIAMRIKTGSNQCKVTQHFHIELVHKKTLKNIDHSHCVNCGAPIEIDEEGRCSYCHTLIQRTSASWQVNKYEQL